jgi:acyl CoA:acetate/3-ketoacid CoA transferase beta subunit
MSLSVGGDLQLRSGYTSAAGTPKSVSECTLPLTAQGVVDTIITDFVTES